MMHLAMFSSSQLESIKCWLSCNSRHMESLHHHPPICLIVPRKRQTRCPSLNSAFLPMMNPR